MNYYFYVIPVNEYGQVPALNKNKVVSIHFEDKAPPRQPTSVSATYARGKVNVSWTDVKDSNSISEQDTHGDKGCIQYAIDRIETTAWTDTTYNTANGSMSVSATDLAEGRHVVYSRGKDSAGNIGTSNYSYFIVDNTPPTAPDITPTFTDWTKADSVSLSWATLTDLHSGLQTATYGIGGTERAADPTTNTQSVDISALADGEQPLWCVEPEDGKK